MTALHKLLLALLLTVPPTVALTGPADSAGDLKAPAPNTIVDITGDAATGFEITYYDRSGLYPPTDSEARAECGEYDRHAQRVRCRTEVRTWYRDLAETQQALDWAHASKEKEQPTT